MTVKPMTKTRARLKLLMLLACLPLGSCASGPSNSVGLAARAGPREQNQADVDRILTTLKPTERLVANADSRLLWQAAQGYMERAFPLDELPPAATAGASKQVRTRLVEWVGDGLPHRTRVFVEVRPDAANAANMRLRVTALMIESEPNFEEAREDVPLQYNWKLVGKNERVEEVVAEQIMRRYLALREGKPLPLEEEMILPGRESGSG
jgi:hypothetical protein